VEYAPGGSDPIHRHNAHGFIYVLEGTIVTQVKGGTEVTLTPGGNFYEGPDDVHIVGRNASNTKPAKFVVFLFKEKGAPVLVPELIARKPLKQSQNEVCCSEVYLRSRMRRTLVFTASPDVDRPQPQDSVTKRWDIRS
jgi:hypothetical protein